VGAARLESRARPQRSEDGHERGAEPATCPVQTGRHQAGAAARTAVRRRTAQRRTALRTAGPAVAVRAAATGSAGVATPATTSTPAPRSGPLGPTAAHRHDRDRRWTPAAAPA